MPRLPVRRRCCHRPVTLALASWAYLDLWFKDRRTKWSIVFYSCLIRKPLSVALIGIPTNSLQLTRSALYIFVYVEWYTLSLAFSECACILTLYNPVSFIYLEILLENVCRNFFRHVTLNVCKQQNVTHKGVVSCTNVKVHTRQLSRWRCIS